MFIDKSDLLHEMELAVRFNYDSGSIVDQALAIEAQSADSVATAQTLKVNPLVTPESLQTLSDTQEYIHWNSPPTPAAQYLTLEATTENQIPLQQFDPQSPEALQAMEMLLANNGSLFNGGVGGLPVTPDSSNRIASERAERAHQLRTERRRRQVLGVPGIDLYLDGEESEDDEQEQHEHYEMSSPYSEGETQQEMGAYETLASPGQSATRGLVS